MRQRHAGRHKGLQGSCCKNTGQALIPQSLSCVKIAALQFIHVALITSSSPSGCGAPLEGEEAAANYAT